MCANTLLQTAHRAITKTMFKAERATEERKRSTHGAFAPCRPVWYSGVYGRCESAGTAYQLEGRVRMKVLRFNNRQAEWVLEQVF